MDAVEGPDRLWALVQSGDADAFARVYDLHAGRIFNHCYRRILSRQDAEDLTAEVFALAWRKRTEIRLVDQVGGLPWLLVTANHLMHRHRLSAVRSRALRSRIPAQEPGPDHAGMIVERIDDDHTLALIASVLGTLSRRDRDVVQLCVIEGLTPTQVATASGEPASSVRSRLSRALAKARREYRVRLDAAATLPTGRVSE
ncbi:RNA polymerase sigma-70 factor (ECF subfamily) [Nakamurella sp. UYEF19]|uniref:RNA polymerase sigma factor n=1 Tax=Nakamurella sp. UYEF19 TaxID=1756392 RepID=UPI00339A39B8